MGWNNAYPAAYPPIYQNPYQMQNPYLQPTQMPVPNQQAQTAPQMTPPTIRAEIVQVDDETAAAAFPVGAGASQMMISKDESAIFIKSATANGQTMLDVYQKRPPAPPAPVFDPGEYVRKDEIEKLVSAVLASQTATQKRTAKKDEVE